MPRWVFGFRDQTDGGAALLGGKGAGLAEMTRLGIPVPPGFTISTAACRAMLRDGAPPDALWEEVRAALATLERALDRRLGDPAAPLLVSVRSGAEISMPGMMETILNLGLNEATLPGLAATTDERFALDCYRRFLQMYGTIALEIDERRFTVAADETPAATVARFREIIGPDLPADPFAQLQAAVLAVFRSWNAPRAIAYRRANAIRDDLGTAVTIQAMVFGNAGADSGTGVAFTRDPNDGTPGLFGEFLPNAQGEDIVAGVRTPLPLTAMRDTPALRAAYDELHRVARRLERRFRDMQDLEFTVEHGRLWLLQTRTGKRTAAAAVAIALDLEASGLIDRPTAVRRVQPSQIDQLLHPRIDERQALNLLAIGLPASPGAVSGQVVFDPVEAKERGEQGEAIILVRHETVADDFPGMAVARGFLTARGGMTSHAAVVARGMGKPAVTGCEAIAIDEAAGCFRVGERVVRAGDEISLDGATGRVFLGRVATIEAALDARLETLLGWADEIRRLGVRANADTPADAARAARFGADGIGLCRTEHMFFGEDRIDLVRALILAEEERTRAELLARLESFQTADFLGIFRQMAGRPVVIRTLDPPLHEFLPRGRAERDRLAARLEIDPARLDAKIAALDEANPMLGWRGCRLGIVLPGLTRMQARAIARAAVMAAADGAEVMPEVMIPLVAEGEELRRQREVILAAAEEIFAWTGRRVPLTVGTMIEVPRAALLADEIAPYADFFSFGTNDLTQMTFGLSRDDAGRFLPYYLDEAILPADPFQTLDRSGVGQLVRLGTERGRAGRPGLKIGLCGEHGGDPETIAFCHTAGLDYVSCSPFRLLAARLAAAHAALAGESARVTVKAIEAVPVPAPVDLPVLADASD